MSNLPSITINGVDLAAIEAQGQRVVTLGMVDRVHQRADGTARRNFTQNRDRLIEGEDYFVIQQPDEIRSLGLQRRDGSTPASITLLAESGYLMLVKSFTDDLAWEVQRKLVNAYFRAKPAAPAANDLTAVLEDPAKMRHLLLHHVEARMEAERQLAEAQPILAAYDRLAGADGSVCITDAAKSLQMQPRALFAWLSANKWIYRRAGCAHWVAYQDRIQALHLEHKVTEVTRGDGTAKITEQVRVTRRGMALLAKRLGVPEAEAA